MIEVPLQRALVCGTSHRYSEISSLSFLISSQKRAEKQERSNGRHDHVTACVVQASSAGLEGDCYALEARALEGILLQKRLPACTPGRCKQHLHRQSASNILDCLATSFLLSGERAQLMRLNRDHNWQIACMAAQEMRRTWQYAKS